MKCEHCGGEGLITDVEAEAMLAAPVNIAPMVDPKDGRRIPTVTGRLEAVRGLLTPVHRVDCPEYAKIMWLGDK